MEATRTIMTAQLKTQTQCQKELSSCLNPVQTSSAIVSFPNVFKCTTALRTAIGVTIKTTIISRFVSTTSVFTFIPVQMDLESGTGSSQVSLWNLPEELQLCILKNLHIKDVLNMRAVNSIFRDLIDDCSAVWKAASFQNTWPSATNIRHFEKAVKFGNMEALIKMAIAHLFNEGVPQGEDWTRNKIKAAEFFCQIEAMTPFEPFTWLFVRLPYLIWSGFARYKVVIHMEKHLQKNKEQNTKNLNVSVAKCLISKSIDESTKFLPSLNGKNADVFLSNAKQFGSGCAAFLLWKMEYNNIVSSVGARRVESIRQLREIARMGHLESKLLLCKMYANGVYGGIAPKQAAMFVRELAQSTTPANTEEYFKTSQELTTSIRYDLVNSLVDIAVEKNFSGHTLYTAVSVVDRYLKCHAWNELELVGVSAMLLCSRFLEEDSMSLNDAVGFVSIYHDAGDVLRMVGEITASLKGNIRVPNSLDFLEIFSSVAELDKKCSCLAEYVCELTLLYAEMGHYSSAKIAASSVLLARLLMKLDVSWPDKLSEFSGYTIEDLRHCVTHMHTNCILQERLVDPILGNLQAVKVKQRYAEEKFHRVSEIPIPSYEELCYSPGMWATES